MSPSLSIVNFQNAKYASLKKYFEIVLGFCAMTNQVTETGPGGETLKPKELDC